MSVNINREVQDAFYRYKMPRLQSKIEGKGNGIKTVVTNMEDIARSLARPPSYSTKYFGCELGAQTIMDEKASRYIVNGAHETQRLAELLDGFIKRFVLCPSCSNPETVMHVDKKGIIMLDCKACGAQSKADNTHKLVTFILKNPPNAPASSSSGAKKKTKEERRKERAVRSANPSRRGSDDDEDGDEAEGAHAGDGNGAAAAPINGTDSSPSLKAGAAADDEDDDSGLQFTPALTVGNDDSVPSTPGGANDTVVNGDEEFSADVLAAAEAMRQSSLSTMNDSIRRLIAGEGAPASSTTDKPSSKADAASQFADEVSKATDGASLRTKAEKLKLREDRAAAVAVQVWFADALLTELPKRIAVLKQFVSGARMQLGVLGGLERLVSQKEWSKDMPRVLKYLYDRDVLEEDVILQWADNTSSDYVKPDVAKEIRLAADPFLSWLRTAEEESDSE